MLLLTISALIMALLVALGGLWVLSSKQPSRAIQQRRKVVFMSVRLADPGASRSSILSDTGALWHKAGLFPFLGAEHNDWTDFLVLPDGSGLPQRIQNQPGVEDVYAAEVRLSRVPPLFVAVLRAMHLLGLSKKPSNPLPERAEDLLAQFEGNAATLPTVSSIESCYECHADVSVTMVNYLDYNALETGGKKAGRDLYNRYGFEAIKSVHRVGGQFLFAGRVTNVLVEAKHGGATAGLWDDLAAMIYPDPTAILYMEQHPDYKRSLRWRDQALARSVVIASTDIGRAAARA